MIPAPRSGKQCIVLLAVFAFGLLLRLNQTELSLFVGDDQVVKVERALQTDESQSLQDHSGFLSIAPDDLGKCTERRGEHGRWVQDWSYANTTNYPNHGSYSDWHIAAQKFVPCAQQPYRLATSWVWQDERCPVSVTEKESFCQACEALNISRILIVGDSLSIEFTRSLVSLLGHPPPPGPASRFKAHFRPVPIHCTTGRKITVLGARLSPIEDWHHIAAEVAAIKSFQLNSTSKMPPKPSPLRMFVKRDSAKTAIVANLGAWIKTEEEYRVGFDALLGWIGTFDNVIPFFRETIPGHAHCKPNIGNASDYDWSQPVEEEPFVSYEHYASTKGNETIHNWEMFESFNAYAKEQIRSISPSLKIHWLNVFNSSVLRRDGHIGWGDCLHYYLPGPPDWWVHFFHSALLDMAHQNTVHKMGVS